VEHRQDEWRSVAAPSGQAEKRQSTVKTSKGMSEHCQDE